MRCPCPHSLHARDDLCPDRLGRRLWVNQLSPAIVVASEAFDPAVAFHAIENADEGGRLQMHPLGQLGLSERPFEREKTEHLGLPVCNAGWREFFVNRPLILVRRGHDPKTDAILEVVFKHGNGFCTNGKRPNDFRIRFPYRRSATSRIQGTYWRSAMSILADDYGGFTEGLRRL